MGPASTVGSVPSRTDRSFAATARGVGASPGHLTLRTTTLRLAPEGNEASRCVGSTPCIRTDVRGLLVDGRAARSLPGCKRLGTDSPAPCDLRAIERAGVECPADRPLAHPTSGGGRRDVESIVSRLRRCEDAVGDAERTRRCPRRSATRVGLAPDRRSLGHGASVVPLAGRHARERGSALIASARRR